MQAPGTGPEAGRTDAMPLYARCPSSLRARAQEEETLESKGVLPWWIVVVR